MRPSLMQTALGPELWINSSFVGTAKEFMSFMEAHPRMMDQHISIAVQKYGEACVIGYWPMPSYPKIQNSQQN